MSHFSHTLDSLMRARGWNQSTLALQPVGVGQTMISRYINAEARPERDALEKICRVFGDDGPRLLLAFLHDEVPDSYRDEIELRLAESSTRVQETPGHAFDRFPPAVQQTALKAAAIAARNARFHAALDSMNEAAG